MVELPSFSQKTTIKIKTDNNNYPVEYVLPINNSYCLSINEEKSFPQNNTLNLTVDSLTKPCFSSINYGQKGQLYFILEPNDTLDIYFKKTALQPYSKKDSVLEWLELKGSKSDLHYALNKGILQLGELSKQFKKHNANKNLITLTDYISAIGVFLEKQTLTIDSLCVLYHATNEYRNTAKAAVISLIIGGVEMNMSGTFFDGSNRQQEGIHDELRTLLFEKYWKNLYNYMEQIPLGLISYQKYLWETEGKKLDDSNDASFIIPVNNDHQGRRVYQLLPEKLQAPAWAEEIMAHNINSPNANRINMALSKYCLQYPNSPYIPILKRKLEFKEVGIPNYSLIDSTSKSKDFEELINSNLPNSNSYFFVDLWATWCGGCKVDFRKFNEFMPFFRENNIKCLFVSIDEKEKKDLWKSMVNGFMMEGYHTRANLQFRQFLEKKIFKGDASIPRYFLIDNKGKILKQFDERLTDIPQLKEKIKKIVKSL